MKNSRLLAGWFAQHYVADEQLTDAALAALAANGGRMSETLSSAIGWALAALPAGLPPYAKRWAILMEDDPQVQPALLVKLLETCSLPTDESLALLLFDRLSRPGVALSPWQHGLSIPGPIPQDLVPAPGGDSDLGFRRCVDDVFSIVGGVEYRRGWLTATGAG